MIGALANRPRVLRLAATYADMWNAWLSWEDNSPAAIPPLRDALDASCRDVGRDPRMLARSVSVQVDLPGAQPNLSPTARPLTGTPAEIAAVLRDFAREGIDHIQLVLNPNTLASIERIAPAVTMVTAGGGKAASQGFRKQAARTADS